MGNIKLGLLEDVETGENLNNVETTLSGLGIKLRDAQDHFRDFDDVLDEVASKWSTYSNVQQRALAVSFAGTRQQERFFVLMENYGKALDYAQVATNSLGVATDKYNNSYLKSVEAAQDRVTASFESLSQSFLSSDLLTGVFNTGSGILGFLNGILTIGDGVIYKIALIAAGVALLNKAFLASTGRHKMICLINMPVNKPVVTRNELIA